MLESKTMRALADLDLNGIAVSAVIEADGRLGKVDGIEAKLKDVDNAIRNGHLKLTPHELHTIIVADAQHDVPPQYLKSGLTFRVIPAKNIHAAIEQLQITAMPWQIVQEIETKACVYLSLLNCDNKIPMDVGYQQLPLLRELTKQEIEKAKQEAKQQESLPENSIIRWEESVGSHPARQYQRLTFEEVFKALLIAKEHKQAQSPRIIVLGPPGSGKTTLNAFLAHQCLNDSLAGYENKLPISVSLRVWQQHKDRPSLCNYLTEYYWKKSNCPESAPNLEQWLRWLNNGDLLLLLDGVDELDDGDADFFKRLKEAFSFNQCTIVITCRTVSYGLIRQWFSEPENNQFTVFTLEGMDNQQRDRFIHNYKKYIAQGSFSPDHLIKQIHQAPQMQALVATPLLLGMICYIVEDKGIELPATRGELYARIISSLFNKSRHHKDYPSTAPLDEEKKIIILEKVALELFCQTGGTLSLSFSEEAFDKALAAVAITDNRILKILNQISLDYGIALEDLIVSARKSGNDQIPEWIESLKKDLIENSGLLRYDGQAYFFFHLTIHEYLTAKALSRQVYDLGWQAKINLGGKTRTLEDLIDHKAWSPRWQEVIVLLAGMIEQGNDVSRVKHLLDMLTDEGKDDDFRHRLALAALCLGEVSVNCREKVIKEIDEITKVAFEFWIESREMYIFRDIVDLIYVESISVLIHIHGKLGFTDISVRLADGLRCSFWQFLPAIEKLGPAIVQNQVLSVLLQNVLDENVDNFNISEASVQMLGTLNSSTEIKKVVTTLLDSNRRLLFKSIAAIVSLGMSGAADQVLDVLVERVKSELYRPVTLVYQIIKELGPAAVRDDVLEVLVDKVKGHSNDCDCIVNALLTLGGLGPAAARENVLIAVVERINDNNDSMIREYAIETISELGVAAEREKVLFALIRCVEDKEDRVRHAALKALSELNELKSNVLIMLKAQFKNGDAETQNIILQGLLDEDNPVLAVLNNDVLDRLLDWLNDDDERLACAGADMLGKLGSLAVRDDILTALVTQVERQSGWTGVVSAKALGDLGPTAVTEDVLMALVEHLQEVTAEPLWVTVVETLIKLGVLVNRNDILTKVLTSLIEAMKVVDGDYYEDQEADCRAINTAAQYVLEGLHNSFVVSDDLVTIIVQWLFDYTRQVKETAVSILQKFDTLAVRDKVSTIFVGQLKNDDVDVCWGAFEALAAVGPSVLRDEVKIAVVELLKKDGEFLQIWEVVAEVLAQLAPSVLTGDLLIILKERSKNPSPWIRAYAIDALAAFGSSGVINDVREALIGGLEDEAYAVRKSSIKALEEYGASIVEQDITMAIIERIIDVNEDSTIREAAIEVLCKFAPAAVTDTVLKVMLNKLNVKDAGFSTHCTIVKAFGQLGPSAVRNDVLTAIVQWLKDSHPIHRALWEDETSFFRRRAVAFETLGKLGSSAAREDVLAIIVESLKVKDPNNWNYLEVALGAISKFGSSAATDEVLTTIVEHYIASEYWARDVNIIELLEKLGLSERGNDNVWKKVVSLLLDNQRSQVELTESGYRCFSSKQQICKIEALSE